MELQKYRSSKCLSRTSLSLFPSPSQSKRESVEIEIPMGGKLEKLEQICQKAGLKTRFGKGKQGGQADLAKICDSLLISSPFSPSFKSIYASKDLIFFQKNFSISSRCLEIHYYDAKPLSRRVQASQRYPRFFKSPAL